MRTARIKPEGDAYYHVMSRVVDRRMVIDDDEKAIFRRIMRAMEGFSGVRVMTYAVLDNHFHLCLHVPRRDEVDDEAFISRLGCIYKKSKVRKIQRRLQSLREKKQDDRADELKAEYTYRMYDLSEFMKTVKQRFTQGFNDRHERKGTLWEERFKSVLLEAPAARTSGRSGRRGAMATVAPYIDLNAVRAGIVDDPQDYPYCGYGEAVRHGQKAREGLVAIVNSLMDACGWAEASAEYRKLLCLTGGERGSDDAGRPLKRGFSPREVAAVLEAGGALSLELALRCRVRYFSDGVTVGSRRFAESVRARYPECFGQSTHSRAAAMTGADWGGLWTARRLRKSTISVPEIVT